MSLDHELIKTILLHFERASKPFLNMGELIKLGDQENTDKILYHLDLSLDKNLITRRDGKSDLGVHVSPDASALRTINYGVEFRLTATGHEYLSSIKKPQIWEKIKKKAGDFGLDMMMDVAKEVTKEVIKSQMS